MYISSNVVLLIQHTKKNERIHLSLLAGSQSSLNLGEFQKYLVQATSQVSTIRCTRYLLQLKYGHFIFN
jgi:hypothetical protein